jgi:hypothetical protein
VMDGTIADDLDARGILARCQADPVFFSDNVLGRERPWERQVDIMLSVRDNRRTAVPSGFAAGKTWVAAQTALWFLFAHMHSLVITTAPTWRQVENVLWAEIRRQHGQSRIQLGGRALRTHIRLDDDWFAIGLSTDDPTRFQGFHNEHVLVIFDEAAGVSRQVWEAAEGQMAGAHSRWLAIGNPVASSGAFYDACKSDLWKVIRVSCLDTPNLKAGKVVYPKLVTPEWVSERRREWGEDSPLYQSKVLGQFPTASEHGLIPLAWVIAANERIDAATNHYVPARDELRIGVDVARSGADSTVFLLRDARRILEIESHHSLSITESTGRLHHFVARHGVAWRRVHIDVIGFGAGVVDILNEQNCYPKGVNFGAGPHDAERFANMRAECYWRLREALRPDIKDPLAIPADFGLLGSELASIEWHVTSSGKIILEPKEKLKQRIGRSPDHADALALSYCETPGGNWLVC